MDLSPAFDESDFWTLINGKDFVGAISFTSSSPNKKLPPELI